jgi:hypothetical protein
VKEPTSFIVQNPSRVIPAQLRFLSLINEQRYKPVRNHSTSHTPILSGILLLEDNDPNAPQEVTKGPLND